MNTKNTIEVKCDACKTRFDREQKYFDSYEECKDKRPSAARFFHRKTTTCDPCIKKKIERAMKNLPTILCALASQDA